MNILLLPSWGYSTIKGKRGINGPELRFLWLAEEYARNNMRVHIIYPLDGALYEQYAGLCHKFAGINCTFIKKFNKLSYLFTAIKIMRSQVCTVIQTHGGIYLDFVGSVCSLMNKCCKHVCGKAIVSKHEQNVLTYIKYTIVDLICKLCGSQFVTISQLHKVEFLKQSHIIYGNMLVIYNGAAWRSQRVAWNSRPTEIEEKHKIVCVAQFTPCKDHNRLLTILKSLEAKIKDKKLYELTLIGNGPLATKLVHRFENELSMRIEYLDHVTDIIQEIKRHDTLILVSRREGVPLCVIQAMLSGLGVVTTDTGAIREVLPATPGYLISNDNDEIVQYLQSREKPVLDQNMHRMHWDRFCIEAMADSYIELFKSF